MPVKGLVERPCLLNLEVLWDLLPRANGNLDSKGKRTTSAECITDISGELTVRSGPELSQDIEKLDKDGYFGDVGGCYLVVLQDGYPVFL